MTHEETKAWLAGLKAGDEVCIPSRSGWARTPTTYRPITIERVTATQIIAAGDRRFRRDNGHERGRDYCASDILHPYGAAEKTANEMAARRQSALGIIEAAGRWDDQPLEVLERVAAVLKEAKGEVKP